jgi:hypothetical protein
MEGEVKIMKDLITRLFEPRYPARYIGRHRAPSALPVLVSAPRRSRTETARIATFNL